MSALEGRARQHPAQVGHPRRVGRFRQRRQGGLGATFGVARPARPHQRADQPRPQVGPDVGGQAGPRGGPLQQVDREVGGPDRELVRGGRQPVDGTGVEARPGREELGDPLDRGTGVG